MIRPLARPGIIVPSRGLVRPQWPYTINRDSPQAQGLEHFWPIRDESLGLIDLAGGNQVYLNSTAGTATKSTLRFDEIHGPMTLFYDQVYNVIYTSLPTGQVITDGAVALWVEWRAGISSVLPFWYGANAVSLNHFGFYGDCYCSILREDRPQILLPFPLVDRQIYSLVINKKGSDWRLWVNGRTNGNVPVSTSITINRATLGTPVAAATNACAEFRIYNRALTDSEIWQLYDPRTRWDLYYPLNRRTFFIPASVQAQTGDWFSPLTGF